MPWIAFDRDWTWVPTRFRRRWQRAFKAGTVTLQTTDCAAAAVADGAARILPPEEVLEMRDDRRTAS